MTKSIRALLSSAAHSVVRGLAVVALVVVWSVGHIGTYALSVGGVSTAVLTTTATPADACWRRGWRGRRSRCWRRWGATRRTPACGAAEDRSGASRLYLSGLGSRRGSFNSGTT